MKKTLSWEVIKAFLYTELQKTHHIQTFGTIGSCNIQKDIDIIATKNPESSISQFLQETSRVIQELNKYVRKKYKKKVIQFFRLDHQNEILHIGKRKKGDICIHLFEYFSLNHLMQDWSNIFNSKEKITKFILTEYQCIFGNQKNIFKKKFNKSAKNENLIFTIRKGSRFNCNYPKKLIVQYTKAILYYAQKHLEKSIKFRIKSVKDAEFAFYKTIEIIEQP